MYRITGVLVLVVALGTVAPASGQALPTEPVSLGDGRLVLGAEVTASVASEDPGYFNYTDYEYSALRNFRVGVSAEVRASSRLQLLGELRMDQGDVLQPFALFARIRPWPDRRLDINVGRIPPTFGVFGRSTYGTANMLVGTPLAYQYLTSLRTDALPAVPDDLIRMHGRGWYSELPVGNTEPHQGVPIINSIRWDTGVQVHGVNGIVEWTTALTSGSLSNPRVGDDNGGRQLAARAVVRPDVALALGISASRGAFLSRSLRNVLAPEYALDDAVQQALGLDAEYSKGRFLGRSEVIWSRWTLPLVQTASDIGLRATSVLGEARYRIFPGVHVAARAERLGFNRVQTSTQPLPWEAPVRRLEVGAGYSIVRNVMVKGALQRNVRDGGRVRRDTLGALQVVYWF